jgi:hypothetical protein
VPVEDVADRSPFDAEPVTEFVHRRAGSVVGDQLLDSIRAELPGTAGAVALGRRRLGRIEAGELLTELFQGSDLVLCVRVRPPNLHSKEGPAIWLLRQVTGPFSFPLDHLERPPRTVGVPNWRETGESGFQATKCSGEQVAGCPAGRAIFTSDFGLALTRANPAVGG